MQATQEPAVNDQQTTDQVVKLRQQLAERELAVMRAILANTELQQKVADAEDQAEKYKTEAQKLQQQPTAADAIAEIARLKKEWSQTQKAQQREHATRRAELVKVRTQYHQAQKQFEDESRARRVEQASASATIARLERDLGDMRVQAKKSREELVKQQKTKWKFVLAAMGSLALVCGAVYFWPSGSAGSGDAEKSPAQTIAQTSKTPGLVRRAAPLPAQNFSGLNGPEFSRSVNRLSDALASFGGRTPQDVLREVKLAHAKDEPGLCAFQWNNGQPSLMLVGDQPNITISSTLNRCALAVEAYRDAKK